MQTERGLLRIAGLEGKFAELMCAGCKSLNWYFSVPSHPHPTRAPPSSHHELHLNHNEATKFQAFYPKDAYKMSTEEYYNLYAASLE